MTNAELHLLLREMAKGSRSALARFYEELEKPVFRFILSKLNDRQEASDILHEVFLDVWRAADRFEGRSTVKTWVFGIAYRKTMDHFRKHSRMTVTAELPDLEDEAPGAFSCLVTAEEAAHLKTCLDDLKHEHRTAIELAFYEDMTYHEIAAVMDVPEGTIKSRIYHAKKLLLKCLSCRSKMGPI